MKTTHYRQGDLLIEKIDSLPRTLKKRVNNIILYGSQTGHSHFLAKGSVYESKKGTVYLELPTKSQVKHDSDHDPINLPKGFYVIIRQKEHLFGDMVRVVVD